MPLSNLSFFWNTLNNVINIIFKIELLKIFPLTDFETLKTITIEVEEWKDEHGNPSVFYSEPLTLEEKNTIFKKSNNFQDLTVLVDLLIMKLKVKDDKGEMKKAFEVEDKFPLRKKADSNVIATIANKILLETNYEDAEKK